MSVPAGLGRRSWPKGFARWWRDTGGVEDPRLVFWRSFEPGAASFGLDGAITGIGLAVFGMDFARLNPAERLGAVKQLLGQHRSLLVWDNFESVREMPDPAGATPPLAKAECVRLREFLDWVRDHSRSARDHHQPFAERTWLGKIRRVGVGGLNRAEAAQYAGHLLAPYPAAQQRRERPSFGELLEWLDGHPLAMRLTLPLLDADRPGEPAGGAAGDRPAAGRGRAGGQAVVAGGLRHLLLRPPIRAGEAAAPGPQSVPRRRRRRRLGGILLGRQTVPARFTGISKDAVVRRCSRMRSGSGC